MKKQIFNLLYIVLLTVILTSCDSHYEELYTIEECRKFQPGDTVYKSTGYMYEKLVVVKNVPSLGLVEARDVEHKFYVRIYDYKDFLYK